MMDCFYFCELSAPNNVKKKADEENWDFKWKEGSSGAEHAQCVGKNICQVRKEAELCAQLYKYSPLPNAQENWYNMSSFWYTVVLL